MVFFFIFLTLSYSLTMIISSYIHVVANGIIFFFFMAEQQSILYVYHVFFIHSSVDGNLHCFLVLAIVNSAAMNIGLQESVQIIVFSRYMPRSGIAGSYGNPLVQLSEETPYCFPQWLHQLSFPLVVQEGSLFSTSSPTFVICRFSVMALLTGMGGTSLQF